VASPAPADTDDLRSAQHCDRVAGWPIVIGRETWSEMPRLSITERGQVRSPRRIWLRRGQLRAQI